MKFKPVLRSVHDFKKDGYKFFDKLHKLEKKKNLDVYQKRGNQGVFVLLSIKELAELLKMTTSNVSRQKSIQDFIIVTDKFLMYFSQIVMENSKINRNKLASYLKAYTSFFNTIIKEKVKFSFSPSTDVQWTARCTLTYTAAWGVK